MKTDIDIVDDVYQQLKANDDLWEGLSGYGIDRSMVTLQPRDGSKEQVTIALLANGPLYEVQEAYINVNIFVRDVAMAGTSAQVGKTIVNVADRLRINSISHICADCMESFYGNTYRCSLESQRVFEEKETGMHYVNNKILYKQLNA